MAMSDEQCEKLFNSIVEMNKNMAGMTQDLHWLAKNAENQVQRCKRNEECIAELEKWMGRSKGHFKVLGRALAVISAAIIAAVTILYQRLGGG
jgi:uncharacterized lipoprotein YehR (DUF1307 family)